jgi:hypothetical protein
VAQPQINKVNWNPQAGGLNSDIDPKQISRGDLIVTGVNSGAMNIRSTGKGTNVSPSYEPVYGNDFVYNLDPVTPQNKKWRINVDTSQAPVLVGQPDVTLNGNFSTGLTDWNQSVPLTWTTPGSYAQHVAGVGNASSLFQSQTGIDPGFYTVQFDIILCTAGTLSFPTNQFSNTVYTSNGTYTAEFPVVVDSSGNFIVLFFADDNFDGAITNIVIKKVAEVYGFYPYLGTSSGTQLNFTFPFFWPVFNDVSQSLTAISNWIQYTQDNISTHSPATSEVVTGPYTGYVELELTDYPYFNYIFTEEYIASISNIEDCINIVVSGEAIDPSCVGEWNLIGSDDKTGNSFEFWTTRRSLAESISIYNVIDNGSGVIQVQTTDPHNFVQDQAVTISGTAGVPEAVGTWTVNIIDQFTFDLNNSAFIGPSYISGGTVIYNIYGLGEIGVAYKDDNGIVFYKRLLRSIEFNFSTLKQIDVRVKRKQDSRFAAYYTDNYNVPRVFYYKGPFIDDGALTIVVPDNIYEYGNISSESAWLLNNEDFRIEVIGQTEGGGALKSGNWRYSARLLTSNFTGTNWSQLTEGIPVFFDSNNDENLIGSNPDVVCSKVNNLKLTNNLPGVFTYVEIAGLNYFNNLAPTGYIIGRFILNQDTEQLINHTGLEQGQIDLDVVSLNDFTQGFSRAQNVELLDNRAILSNLTPSQTIDFSDWVKTFEYSLNRKTLNPVGVWSTDSLQVGEYQEPMNVYSYKSHMMMETYRYGFRFRLKNGTLTQVFYPGYDIKIDLPATATLPNERVPGSFTTFDLTDQASGPVGPSEVYSIYISWENINLGYLIDGIAAYELIDEIIPCRATVIPEVLVHGCGALGVTGDIGLAVGIQTLPLFVNTYISPYPLVAGDDSYSTSDIYPGFDSFSSTSFTANRSSIFMYAPDLYFDLNGVDFQVGDEIYVFGSPARYQTSTWLTTGLARKSWFSEFDGYTDISTNPAPYVFSSSSGSFLFDHPSGAGGPLSAGPSRVISGSIHTTSIIARYLTPSITDYIFKFEKTLACKVSTNILDNNNAGNNDYGFYRAIYYRPRIDKYGDPRSTIYTEFLDPFVVGDFKQVILSGDFNSYGDCFTQKSYLKYRYPGWWEQNLPPDHWRGWGASIGFYTQNRNNIQLRCALNNDFDDSTLPTKVDWRRWISFGYATSGTTGYTVDARFLYVAPEGQGRDAQLFYNTGYTPVNNVVSQASYNPLVEYQTDWGNAIAWSDPENEGSNTDNLRNFPPLNITFLDYTQGSITDARAVNGELVTVQPREVQRQYFNTTAMQTTVGGGEVYLGTGAVLSRRGTTMNKFGSRHKWSVIMGLSDKGHDVLYGIDDINNTVWRLGYDGTNSLDEIQGMKAFFANNLQWIKGKYTPAHDEGIRGVADQRYRDVIWTLRGRKQYPEWQAEDNEYYSFEFDNNQGQELLVNGDFNGNLNGWDTFYPPPTLGWFYGAPAPYNSGIPYGFGAACSVTYPLDNYLKQVAGVPFVVGQTYVITINVAFYDPGVTIFGLDIYFQSPFVTAAYTINTAGSYSFNYTAVSGDDNIYIQRHGFTSAIISSVSVASAIQTGQNWSGYPDWILSNNEACTVGSTGTSLIQTIPNYITPNRPYILEFTVSDYVSGDLRVGIGNVTSPPVGITGPIPPSAIYSVGLSPTATGVVRFNPSVNFEGCIKGNVVLRTTGVLKEYNTGDIVQTSGYGAIMSTWSQTPDIWVCLKDNVTSNPYTPPDPDDPDWELIPHTNPDYYTEYTIVYNELKNKFQCFMSILPRIYAHFENGYLVPRPISNTGRVYISNGSTPTSWFDTQTGDAFFDATINTPAGRKRYLAVRVESDLAPTSMTVSTNTGSSTTFAGEFEQREGNEFDGYVKDSLSNSIIYGDFGIFRFTIAATTYNKINSFIASVRERARKWFK